MAVLNLYSELSDFLSLNFSAVIITIATINEGPLGTKQCIPSCLSIFVTVLLCRYH